MTEEEYNLDRAEECACRSEWSKANYYLLAEVLNRLSGMVKLLDLIDQRARK